MPEKKLVLAEERSFGKSRRYGERENASHESDGQGLGRCANSGLVIEPSRERAKSENQS
jgi:hypothetical protein